MRGLVRISIAGVSLSVAGAALVGCEQLQNARGATSLLQVFSPTSPAEAARWAVDEFDADLRFRGTLLLANSFFGGEPVYVQLYADHTDDPNPNVRAAGVRGLANHGGPEHVPLLLDRLGDESVSVRLETVRALQRLHNPAAIEPLLDIAVRDRTNTPEVDAGVRAEAADALGQYADPRVVFGLAGDALADPDLVVASRAAASLTTLTGQDFGLNRGAWNAWLAERSDAAIFAARSPYFFPVFEREKTFWEHLPLVPPPPNEASANPSGFPPLTSDPFVESAESSGESPDNPGVGGSPGTTR